MAGGSDSGASYSGELHGRESHGGAGRICVFLGSSPGRSPVYVETAQRFGTLLATRGIGLVYGGGRIGLMGAIADAASAAGGEVIGVIPQALRAREIDHPAITELHVVETMHERKAMMAKLSDGFVGLPGGIGTLEELFEVWTWAQLGYHDKPCGLLDVAGFFTPMSAFIDNVVAQGFLQPQHQAMMMIDTDPEALLEKMAHYSAPPRRHWIGEGDV